VLAARGELLGVPAGFPVWRGERRSDAAMSVFAVPCPSPVTPGTLDSGNAGYVIACLKRAVAGCIAGEFDAIVTGPVHKGIINDAGIPFTGHTEFLAREAGGGEPVMMLASGDLRVALATTHLPLAAVPGAITRERLRRVIGVLHHDLVFRFGFATPRIAVLGLNPHAGESGHLGREEIEVITPVIEEMNAAGMHLRGPLPADTAFVPSKLREFDAVLAMYHDQGLPVIKHSDFAHAVNVTLGLPFVRTSVDHGTALALAGTGRADPSSLRAAITVAMRLAQ
jgi:4-hydroxythreonine-4-phosphate dehydrogenase